MFNGKLNACQHYAAKCHYRCCQQERPRGKQRAVPEDSLLLYPLELRGRAKRGHIFITRRKCNGGQLGYCDPSKICQAHCDLRRNYKPLDCRSYPFFPGINNRGELILLKDQRCPLGARKQDGLEKAYANALIMWRSIIRKSPSVKVWIKSFRLPTYVAYKSNE